MGQTNRSRPQYRWTRLRRGETMLAMGMATGMGGGLAALTLDHARRSPPPRARAWAKRLQVPPPMPVCEPTQ